MKLQLVKYKCAQCKSEFKVPHLRSGAYGEFLLRSTSGEVAYLDAMKDSTYDEVFDLIKSHRKIAHQSPNKLAEILRRSYGHIACDKDNQGEHFAIGTSPICPVCKSQDMEYWEVLEPPEFINENIDPVTHNDWNNLSTLQKK